MNKIDAMLAPTRAMWEQLLMENSEEYITTLNHVNAIRAEFYAPALKRLPKGRAGIATECVIAMALRDVDSNVSVTKFSLRGNEIEPQQLPAGVRRFVMKFDHGKYPQLVA